MGHGPRAAHHRRPTCRDGAPRISSQVFSLCPRGARVLAPRAEGMDGVPPALCRAHHPIFVIFVISAVCFLVKAPETAVPADARLQKARAALDPVPSGGPPAAEPATVGMSRSSMLSAPTVSARTSDLGGAGGHPSVELFQPTAPRAATAAVRALRYPRTSGTRGKGGFPACWRVRLRGVRE